MNSIQNSIKCGITIVYGFQANSTKADLARTLFTMKFINSYEYNCKYLEKREMAINVYLIIKLICRIK